LLYDDKLDRKIPEDFYLKKFDQYTQEREEILYGLRKQNTSNTHYYELGANILELAHRAKEIYLAEGRTVEERRTLLNLVFSNLTLQTDRINVSYSKAFEILSGVTATWNATFEPKESRMNETETKALTPVSAPLLPRWDEFRTVRWEELFEDPDSTMQQIERLLNPRVQDTKMAA